MATDNPTPRIVFGDPRLPTHFWAKVEVDPVMGCWLWTASKNRGGYGTFHAGSRTTGDNHTVHAHRHAYETLVGPIPKGRELDHFKFGAPLWECAGPACIHPDHTRPVTPRENTLRGEGPASFNAAKRSCPRGHPYDGVLKDGFRRCMDCRRQQTRDRLRLRRARPRSA